MRGPVFRLHCSRDGQEQFIPLDGPLLIGRRGDEGDGEVGLDLRGDRSVSRRHARVWVEDGRCWIEDLGSSHGTFLDGRRLGRERVEIGSGVPVRIGRATFRLVAPTPPRHPPPLRVEVDCLPRLNYSLIHAREPFVRSLTLINDGDETLDDLELQVALDPFAWSDTVSLAPLSPGARHTLSELGFHYNLQQFLDARDPVSVRLDVRVRGESIAPANPAQVEILPVRAWHDAGHEAVLATFVLKESDAVKEVVARAGALLRCLARGATAFEDVLGHHRDPAATIARTLYSCLQERYEIAYGREPRFYGAEWQAIRFPGEVLHQLEGTCIDLALLFAACLENRSLSPLIVLVQTGFLPGGYRLQHALVGCWKGSSLRWNPFDAADPVEKDGRRILGWMKEGDLILLDPVGFARGKGADQMFSKSRRLARTCMERACARQRGYAFCHAVDVEVARLLGFQPLPVGAEIFFGRSSWLALSRAQQEAAQRGSPAVGGRHLLLGLLSLEDGVLVRALARRGSDLPRRAAEQARTALGVVVKSRTRPPWKKTENLAAVLDSAKERVRRDGRRLAGDADLVIALLENHKKVRGVLIEAGVTPEQCLDEVRAVLLTREDRPVLRSSVPDV